MVPHSCAETDSGGPRILYIMGTGRSGTTILEILLANNPGVFGVGEVTYIFQDGFIEDVTCSCGEQTSSCDLWSRIRQLCDWSRDDISDLFTLFGKIAGHSRFPQVATGLVSQGAKKQFQQVNECLFGAVAELTKTSVIVDSSKRPGRALALFRAFPGRVQVICLTRSPAGLVAAFQKSDTAEQLPKKPLGACAYYLYAMACLRIAAWQLGTRALLIRYEDLMSEPQETLGKIESWGGIDLSTVKLKIAENQWLEVGHIVTGNRFRRKGRVQFSPSSQSTPMPTSISARPVVWFMNLYRSLLGF